jgi:3-oxoacyl-(acyl-carrier-protein) synthase
VYIWESKGGAGKGQIVRQMKVRLSHVAISNSFGFGGVNAVLVLKKIKG